MSRINLQLKEEAYRLEEIDILEDQIRQLEEELNTYRPLNELQQELQQLAHYLEPEDNRRGAQRRLG